MKKLESERLFLRPANLEDGPFIFELLNSASWLKFIGDKKISNLNKAEEYIENSLIKGYSKNGFGLLVVDLSNGTQIGLCGFLKRDYLEYLDLGFAFLPTYEGFGYAYEAASVMMHYGKTKLRLTCVLAICMEANERSLHLLDKLGFKKLDTVKLNEESEELLLLST
tara:strand:+ start:24190 stop:24690 length:501 start_codon:yes stop_codon:yes gene_type:complete